MANRPSTTPAQVIVTVEDKNDNSPVFHDDNYAFSVSEMAAPGTVVVLKVNASDADSGNNGRISFRLVSADGATSPNFEIDEDGVLQVPDRDGPNGVASLQLIIRASDNGEQPRTTTAPLAVTILDENDNDPVFGSYDTTVLESLAVLSNVVTVTATDLDAGDNGRLTYSLDDSSDGSPGIFQIASDTGVVTLAKPHLAVYSLSVKMGPLSFTSSTVMVGVGRGGAWRDAIVCGRHREGVRGRGLRVQWQPLSCMRHQIALTTAATSFLPAQRDRKRWPGPDGDFCQGYRPR